MKSNEEKIRKFLINYNNRDKKEIYWNAVEDKIAELEDDVVMEIGTCYGYYDVILFCSWSTNDLGRRWLTIHKKYLHQIRNTNEYEWIIYQGWLRFLNAGAMRDWLEDEFTTTPNNKVPHNNEIRKEVKYYE